MTVLPQVELTGFSGVDPQTQMRAALMAYRSQVSTDLVTQVSAAAPETINHDWMAERLLKTPAKHLEAFRAVAAVPLRRTVDDSFAEAGVPAEAGLVDQAALEAGSYMAASSSEAAMDGFTRLVNAKVPAKDAAMRVARSWGLTKAQQRALAALEPEKPVKSSEPKAFKKVLDFIEKAFSVRLDTLVPHTMAQISSWALQQAWQMGQATGLIALTAKKMWITAADEFVCPICGPMDGVQVGLDGEFELPDGNKLLMPPVHPRCRCVARRVEDEEYDGPIAKAFDEKEHPRGQGGQFRTKFKPTQFKEQVSPQTAQLFEQVAQDIEQMQREGTLRQNPERTEVQRPSRVSMQRSSVQRNAVQRQSVQRTSTTRAQAQRATAQRSAPLTRAQVLTRLDLTRTLSRAVHTDQKIPPLQTGDDRLVELGDGAIMVTTPEKLGIDTTWGEGKVSLDAQHGFIQLRGTHYSTAAYNEQLAHALRDADTDAKGGVPLSAVQESDPELYRQIKSELFTADNPPPQEDVWLEFSPDSTRSALRAVVERRRNQMDAHGNSVPIAHTIRVCNHDGTPVRNSAHRPIEVSVDSETMVGVGGFQEKNMPIIVKVRQGWMGGVNYETGFTNDDLTLEGDFHWEMNAHGVVTLTPDTEGRPPWK